MKAKIIGVVIAVIVVVAAIALVFPWDEESPYWETEAQFGSWGEELIITYTDGSTDSLKLLEASAPPGELTYGGKGINTVHYKINGKATGTGYTEANIKFVNYVVDMKILSGTTTKWHDVTSASSFTKGIPIDGAWHDLAVDRGANFGDIFKDNDWPDGTYTIKFTPASVGDPIYWGTPGQTSSDGTRVSLPSGKTMTVVWTEDRTLSVVLGSEIET